MKKLAIAFMVVMMTISLSACRHDVYGKLFVHREPVTFIVQTEDEEPLANVLLRTEELDDFDYDLIVDGTHVAYTDDEGKVTVYAPFKDNEKLFGRTTRFTFSAPDYTTFDTIFNYWTDTITITLH